MKDRSHLNWTRGPKGFALHVGKFHSEAKAGAIYAFHETEEHRAVEAQMIELFEALK